MAPATMRSVVLPGGLSGHHTLAHKDAWHQWEGLVVILVGIHFVAFVFWCYLLYASKERSKKASRRKGADGDGPLHETSSSPSKSALDWRTPREILSQYQKARLGKV